MRHAQCRQLGLAAGLLLLGSAATSAPWTVYETGFEPPEFEAGFSLDGQGDWWVPWLASPQDEWVTSQVITDYFPDLGQQALIGQFAPAAQLDSVSVYRPLSIDPVGRGTPLVVFSALMAIGDTTEPDPDSFRWVVYNRDEPPQRLCSLDFDIATGDITYLLEDSNVPVGTGWVFERDIPYDVIVQLDFAANRWSATLNGTPVVSAAPITPSGRTLDLGDIDAAWVLGPGSSSFGDAYMVFDEFRVLTDLAAPLPCQLTPLGFLADGGFLLELLGEPGRTYAIDASPDLLQWTTVATHTPGDGSFVVLDKEAAQWPAQFYVGRAVWP